MTLKVVVDARPGRLSALSPNGALLLSHVRDHCSLIRRQITRPSVERWLVDLPLSNQTRNHLLYAFRTILQEAEDEGLIQRNPLDHAESLSKKGRRRDIFTLEELRSLFRPDRAGPLRVWGQRKYAALYLTLATTGMQEGQARALRWRHVLSEGRLAIEEAVKEDYTFGLPKSGQSCVVALPARARAGLSWWHEDSPFTGVNVGAESRSDRRLLSRASHGEGRRDATAAVRRKTRCQ